MKQGEIFVQVRGMQKASTIQSNASTIEALPAPLQPHLACPAMTFVIAPKYETTAFHQNVEKS